MAKNILIVILIIIGAIVLIDLLNRKSKPKSLLDPNLISSIPSPDLDKITYNSYSTDFFKRSAEYADSVLFGKTFLTEYGTPDFYANKLLNIINKLNDETKNNIKFAVAYTMIQPNQVRESEQLYRMMASQEKVPLWFIILRENTKKIIPEINLNDNISFENKIVPISSQVA